MRVSGTLPRVPASFPHSSLPTPLFINKRGDNMTVRLETCNDGHEEIVYVRGWGTCPLCEAIEEVGTIQMSYDKLKDKVSELQDELDALKET